MARKKISSLKGRTVETVISSGSYVIIKFDRGLELQVAADYAFDKHGDRYEDDAPMMAAPKARKP